MQAKKITKLIAGLAFLLLYFFWKKYHMKNSKHQNPMLHWSHMAFAAIFIIIVYAGIELGEVFATVFIIFPIGISVFSLLRQKDSKFGGFCCLLKGIYYAILAVYSIWQYYNNNTSLIQLAIGFTIALAIFESVVAIQNGIISMRKK